MGEYTIIWCRYPHSIESEKRNDTIRYIKLLITTIILYKVISYNEYFDYRNEYPEAVPEEITIRRMAELHRILAKQEEIT